MEAIMKKMRKYSLLVALFGTALSVLLIIISVFVSLITSKVMFVFSGYYPTAIFLSIVILSIASFFISGACDIYDKKRWLTYVSIISILIASILTLILFWYIFGIVEGEIARNVSEIYLRIVLLMVSTSIIFCIISGSISKLGKSFKTVQILTTIFAVVVYIFILSIIFDISLLFNSFMIALFISSIVATIGFLIAVSILSKKALKDNDDYIKIKRSEYETLLSRIKELEEKMTNHE